jgi:hypothetical protein
MERQPYYLRKNRLSRILPKKIAQIKTPKNNPQRIPSSQPLEGMTCHAVNTAMATLVKAMIFMPPRIDIQGRAMEFSAFFSFFFLGFFDKINSNDDNQKERDENDGAGEPIALNPPPRQGLAGVIQPSRKCG